MARDRIHIEIVQDGPTLSEVSGFLAGFGCQLLAGHGPVRVVRRGKEIIGVSQIFSAPLHLTFWGPGNSARNVAESIDALRIMQEGNTLGGVTYCTAHEGQGAFTPQIMAKLGFEDTGLKIFVSNPHQT